MHVLRTRTGPESLTIMGHDRLARGIYQRRHMIKAL